MNRSRLLAQPTMVPSLVILATLTLIWAMGCSRQVAAPASTATASNRTQLPFDRVSDNGGVTPTAGFTPDSIAVGTALSVRLQTALSSADSRLGDSFQAVLEEPLIVSSRTLAPRGTPVTGKVLAAKASASRYDPGYLRLTLTSILLNGKSIPLHSSSIFAKAAANKKPEIPALQKSGAEDQSATLQSTQNSADGTVSSIYPNHSNVRFSTGRRLTFRLAQPLHVQG